MIDRADIAEFSVLKTYDPALTALRGHDQPAPPARGKFLDLVTEPPTAARRCTWSRTWPGRAGCAGGTSCPRRRPSRARARWRSGYGSPTVQASTSPRPGLASGSPSTWSPTSTAVPGVASLGPDPLDPAFTPDVLAGILPGAAHQIKGVLRDQKLIAGIGNAYSDEVLHAARCPRSGLRPA